MFKEKVIQSLINGNNEYLNLKLDQDPDFNYSSLLNENAADIDFLIHKAPLFGFDADSLTLYLKYIPVEINRMDLENELREKLNGFVHLSMSEPIRNNEFKRLAWASFSTDHDCEQALEQIRASIEVSGF